MVREWEVAEKWVVSNKRCGPVVLRSTAKKGGRWSVVGRALVRAWTKEQSSHAVRNKGDSGVMEQTMGSAVGKQAVPEGLEVEVLARETGHPAGESERQVRVCTAGGRRAEGGVLRWRIVAAVVVVETQ
jgi:hypothetical protein